MTKPISYSRRVISQGKNIIEHQKMFRKDVIWTCLKIGYTGIPIIWVPKIGYPKSSKSFDHKVVLKPMVAWGSLILRHPFMKKTEIEMVG